MTGCEFPRLDWPEEDHGSEPCPNPGTVRVGFVSDDGVIERVGWMCQAHSLTFDAEVLVREAAGERLFEVPVKARAWRGEEED